MLIVCPNLAVDHTITLSVLTPGAVSRATTGRSLAGGKGANVARATQAIGGSSRVIGFLPEVGRGHLMTLFAAEEFDLGGVPVDGVVRTCTATLESDGRTTLINEPGAEVDGADWSALLQLVPTGTGFVIGSGSLPPGSSPDAYARLVMLVHSWGGFCAVDVGGPALAAAARSGADLVCPNLFEATSLTSGAAAEEVDEQGDDIPDRALEAARGLRALGADTVAVTAGAAGVGLIWADDEVWLPTVAVKAVNPIGAGDSFLAGVVLAHEQGENWPAAVRFGMAVAGASVENPGAAQVDPERVAELDAQLALAHC
ncbi:PfkB family carbohydrate kinase [Nakamurella sp. A5-74]|uniref:PfkB family carbohydrate kinase n=1 Tax=Nakamurella sp. A5-74 TaxID=3158264 RepID=A0AAU8DQ70_9ACTN